MEKQELERLLAVGSILRSDAKRIFALISENREHLETIEITLQGGSMSPAIPKGSAIRIQLNYKTRHAPGQIVAFLDHEKIMVHRIQYCGSSRKAKNYFLTRGDAATSPDPPVQLESILGPVIAVQKEGHWLTPGNISPLGPFRRALSALWLRSIAIILEMNVSAAVWFTKRNAN